jgi:hypothetical protein
MALQASFNFYLMLKMAIFMTLKVIFRPSSGHLQGLSYYEDANLQPTIKIEVIWPS